MSIGDLPISYGIHKSPFGWSVVGVTENQVCYLAFLESSDKAKALKLLKLSFPKSIFDFDQVKTQKYIKQIFIHGRPKIKFLFNGTDFQVKVWKAMLKIPEGEVSTYMKIARAIKHPNAVRAVGTACGANKVAFLIPCHRVLASNGQLGGYRWGTKRKQEILAWEQK